MKNNRTKKILLLSAACVVLLAVVFAVVMAVAGGREDVVIYYTNDVHTYIANHIEGEDPNVLTYSKIAALKAQTPNAILVDAGDHIQGSAFGAMDRGETIIKLMNVAGYDVATPGNHELDFGMERLMTNAALADFTYVSCNFHHAKDGVRGDNLFDAYTIIKMGGVRIAFVGISTPESMTSTTPVYLQNEAGEFIYGFDGIGNDAALYAAVQRAVDAARADGADYVIALGHLGIDESSGNWTSRAVIANTTGLDAFIDGHSHSRIDGEQVTDAEGNTVLLTQAVSHMETIGCMTIAADGTVSTELLGADEIAALTPQDEVKAAEDAWIGQVNELLGQVIGRTEVVLDNYDSNGKRLVRTQNTNSGDLVADAVYYCFASRDMQIDGALMNGGGVRNTALQGDLTYRICKDILPFDDVLCLMRMSGQQLLDALEWSVSTLTVDGSTEDGGFLHVAGIRFEADVTIPSTLTRDANDMWVSGPTGEYRVRSVEIYDRALGEWKPLDLTREYYIAGRDYILVQNGNGYTMFEGATMVASDVEQDYIALAQYIMSFEKDAATGLPTIKAGMGYDSVYGDDRTSILPYAPAGAQ